MDGGAADNDMFIKQLEEQLKTIQSTQPDQDSLYNLFSIVSSILIEYRDSNGKSGWVKKVLTPRGLPAFELEKDESNVEQFMGTYGAKILSMLGLISEKQNGGYQHGGEPQTGARDKAMAALAKIGEFVDPTKVSLDGAVEFVLEYLDSANNKMEDMSRQIGIIALQNKVPEIPLQFIGLPPIPTRLLTIIVQGIFEIMRLIALFGFPGAGLFRIVGSLFGGLIELFKGDWKSALFTFMGLAGNGMMTMGLFGKVVVKVLSFMAPSMRDKLVLTGYQSMKSWILGVMLFVFQTVAPRAIKEMVDQNLGKFGDMMKDVQTKIDGVNKTITETDEFKCFTIEWLNLTDPAKMPDYDNLIKLQDLFMQPSFYCNNDVRAFVDQMKFIPPARIILELLGLPTTDRAYSEVCWNLPPDVIQGGLDKAILHALKPVIRPRKPFMPVKQVPAGVTISVDKYNKEQEQKYDDDYGQCPGYSTEQMLREAAAVARQRLGDVFSLGESADPQLTAAASSIRTGTTKFIGDSAETAAVVGKKAKESALTAAAISKELAKTGIQQSGIKQSLSPYLSAIEAGKAARAAQQQAQQQGKPTMAILPQGK